MAEKIISIAIACNHPGQQVGGLNKRDESVGFMGQYTPVIRNMVVEPTRVRKRRGYSQVGRASLPLSGNGTGLFEYVDATGTRHLIAMTTTGAYKYDASAGTWADVSPVAAFTGDIDNRFHGSVVTDTTTFATNGGSALVVTNNNDDLHYFEGDTGDVFTKLVHGYPSFGNCVDVSEFWNHLILLRVTTSSTNNRLLAWADLGDVTEWAAGTSGATTLTDSLGSLKRAVKLGQALVMYSDSSISLCNYIGSSTLYSIPTLVYETGLLCSDGVWGSYNYHCFIGSDLRIYRYYGGTQLDHIGGPVESSLFSELNYNLKERICAMYDPIRYKLYFCFPRSTDTYSYAAYAISTDLDGWPWEYHEFADSVCASSVMHATSTVYCDDATWGEYYCDLVTAYCDDPFGQSDAPVCVFLSHDGYVFMLDERTGYDDATAIECEYQTEDITVDAEESYGRFTWMSFVAMSSTAGTVDVSYSTDGGGSWTNFVDSPVQLTTSWDTYKIPFDASARRVRFRFSQVTADDLQLRVAVNIAVAPTTGRD